MGLGVKIKRQLWECRGENFLIPDGTPIGYPIRVPYYYILINFGGKRWEKKREKILVLILVLTLMTRLS